MLGRAQVFFQPQTKVNLRKICDKYSVTGAGFTRILPFSSLFIIQTMLHAEI